MSDFTTAWQANHSYSLLAVVKPTTFTGFTWRVTTAGTSGGTEPVWPSVGTDTIADGSVTWSRGTGFTQAFQANLVSLMTAFAQANPTIIKGIYTTRPLSLNAMALPGWFLDDITEQSNVMNGVRQRQLTADTFWVTTLGDPRVPNDQSNFMRDVLADLITQNYHQISGQSIITYAMNTDTEFPEANSDFPALHIQVIATVMEGRI